MPHDYDETRRVHLQFMLNTFGPHYSPEQMKEIEPIFKEHIDTTYTDDVLAAQFRQQAADKRAKDAQYWEQWHAAEAAKAAAAKIKRDHRDHLAREKAATAEALEEVEHTKALLRSSQDQIEGLMKAQGK